MDLRRQIAAYHSGRTWRLEFLAGCTLSILADMTHAEPDLRALTRFIMRLGAAVLAFSLLVLFVLPRLSDF